MATRVPRSTGDGEVDSLLAFPCEFPIKIVGRKQPGFAQQILEIVLRHAPDYNADTMEMRPSRQGTYLSLTVTINAVSREQLDALYQELCDHPGDNMVL